MGQSVASIYLAVGTAAILYTCKFTSMYVSNLYHVAWLCPITNNYHKDQQVVYVITTLPFSLLRITCIQHLQNHVACIHSMTFIVSDLWRRLHSGTFPCHESERWFRMLTRPSSQGQLAYQLYDIGRLSIQLNGKNYFASELRSWKPYC